MAEIFFFFVVVPNPKLTVCSHLVSGADDKRGKWELPFFSSPDFAERIDNLLLRLARITMIKGICSSSPPSFGNSLDPVQRLIWCLQCVNVFNLVLEELSSMPANPFGIVCARVCVYLYM